MSFAALHHLTIPTGHVAVTSRADVSNLVVDRLAALIDAEGGPVPEIDMYVDILRLIDHETRRPLDGIAAFTVQLGGRPGGRAVTSNIVCWADQLADQAWATVTDMSATGGEIPSLTGRPITRPDLPWLSSTILPGLLDMPRHDIAALADFERCLAWALIEMPV